MSKSTSLRGWLEFVGIADCTCPMEWRDIGRLYGVSFGKGWVRMTTDAACPHHGAVGPLGVRGQLDASSEGQVASGE